MAAIYQADIWCDGCADSIKHRIAVELFHSGIGSDCPDGHDNVDLGSIEETDEYLRGMNEHDYDSDEYPKYCSDSEESDCPQHCAGCQEFMENDLTSDGADYVREAVRADREAGDNLSIACNIWQPFYDYIDYGPEDNCVVCGDWTALDENDECEDCAEESPEPGWVSDPHFGESDD